MANVLDLLHPTAQPSMNGFDLSSKHVYGSAVGRVDSPIQIETMPRDKFKINLGSLMRTMTPLTAPFLRGKITFDFYFVPYTQIWHSFNQFVGQRKDVHSSLQKGISRVPCIHLYDLLKLIRLVYQNSPYSVLTPTPFILKDIHDVPWYNNIFNMLDFFGFGNFLWLKDVIEDEDTTDEEFLSLIEPYKGKYVNIFRPAAYQHIWYDYYRNKFYDNYDFDYNSNINDYVLAFNFDDIDCSTFANSIIPIDTTQYDAAVNKRIYMLFTQRYVQYKQDLLQSALPSQQFGAVSDVSVDFSSDGSDLDTLGPIYPDTGKSKLRIYSVPGDRDISANSTKVLSFSGEAPMSTQLAQVRTSHHHILSSDDIRDSLSAKFDVLTLKRAEALQKWRQNVLRAGNMVDDNFQAHFGVRPRYESDNVALKLGSFEGFVKVNTVEATAQSAESLGGNQKVGSLGSNCVATIEGKEIQFSCSDFGVIVCIQYFRPESEYSSTMIDRANILSEPFDFPMPELCNIGLDSISQFDYNAMADIGNPVLGFASQYWWLKTALDKDHGEFAKYNCKKFVDVLGDRTKVNVITKGDSVMWCAPRILTFASLNGTEYHRTKSSLYVNPNILDDMFDVYYHNHVAGDKTYYDCVNQLIFNTYFDVKVIRPLTVVGLPNF